MDLRTSLRDLLSRWARGEVDAHHVHERAEALWEELGQIPEYSHRDQRAIPIEVLSQLEILDQQLVEPEDIPQILAFLDTPPGQERAAWKRWEQYWDRLNYDARAERLKDNPYYSALTIHRVPEKAH